MTTEELLWNANFECNNKSYNDDYNYREEWKMERYYEDKELFERLSQVFRPAV